jgi:hypothetical protein
MSMVSEPLHQQGVTVSVSATFSRENLSAQAATLWPLGCRRLPEIGAAAALAMFKKGRSETPFSTSQNQARSNSA